MRSCAVKQSPFKQSCLASFSVVSSKDSGGELATGAAGGGSWVVVSFIAPHLSSGPSARAPSRMTRADMGEHHRRLRARAEDGKGRGVVRFTARELLDAISLDPTRRVLPRSRRLWRRCARP